MNEVSIKGKTFTEVEVREYGENSIRKRKRTLTIIGISLAALAIITALYMAVTGFYALEAPVVNEETGEIMTATDAFSMVPACLALFGIPGVILLALSRSKSKSDPYNEGVVYLNKHFPHPVGFDGNIITLLQGDKTIKISRKPSLKMIVSSAERKCQIVQGRKRSKILSGNDILDFEIKVDNEIVLTSKTTTKKGMGKALVGGALFGTPGMIAGAIAGKSKSTTNQSQKEVHHYTLALKVNDIIHPSFVAELESLQLAEEVVATLMIICGSNEQTNNETHAIEEPKLERSEIPEIVSNVEIKNEQQVTVSKETSVKMDKFEEIKKYKELFDLGIITKEEFDLEKKRILG